MKIAVVSASLGGFDRPTTHATQDMLHDYYYFNDDNFPARFNSMTPRLQAKIPKFFAWQMVPGYDYYLWLDGNITMTAHNSLRTFYEACQDHDIAALKHPRRDSVRWEARYTQRGLNEGSRYLHGRYAGEHLADQMKEIQADEQFEDNLLVNGGMFMYRNTPEVQKMMKEWWYHNSRYCTQDQVSFAYVLKKSGLRVRVIPEIYNHCSFLGHRGHVRHN